MIAESNSAIPGSIIDAGSHLVVVCFNGAQVLIDHQDRHLVEGKSISVSARRPSQPYATLVIDGSRVRLHRLILCAPKERVVDHRNGETLDNRRSNLRLATVSQNCANCKIQAHNTSGYRGVDFPKRIGKWRARIRHAKIQQHLGYFPTAGDAARAYDRKAVDLHGAFARLNFPVSLPGDQSSPPVTAGASASALSSSVAP